ncbi:hypothetical protein D3C75_1156690 [compost metagenome]
MGVEAKTQIAVLKSGGHLHGAVRPLPMGLRWCALQFGHGLRGLSLIDDGFACCDLQRGRVDIKTGRSLLQ